MAESSPENDRAELEKQSSFFSPSGAMYRNFSMSQRRVAFTEDEEQAEKREAIGASVAAHPSEGGTGRSLFWHSLSPNIDPDYYRNLEAKQGKCDPFEEISAVCADLVQCCGIMEEKGLTPENDFLNGQVQVLLQLPLRNLTKPKVWDSFKNSRDACVRNFIPIPQKVVEESSCDADRVSVVSPTIPLLNVGGSKLHAPKGLMAHLWKSPEGARIFLSGWMRIMQNLFEHRIEGISCPVTILYSVGGRYVSLTGIPPIVSKAHPPIDAPHGEEAGTMLGYYASQLLTILGNPQGSLQLHFGADGRFYIMSLKDILVQKLEAYPESAVRMELIRRQMLTADSSNISLSDFMKKSCVSKCVKALDDYLKSREDYNTIDRVLSARIIPRTLHRYGINLCAMNLVLSIVATEADKEERNLLNYDDESAPPPPQRMTLLRDSIAAEMVARSVKHLARVELALSPFKEDVMNRISRLLVSDASFWELHVIPTMRRKFNLPQDYSIHPNDGSPKNALKHVSERLGIEFSPKLRKFAAFTPVGSVYVGIFDAQDVANQAKRSTETTAGYSKDELELATAEMWTMSDRQRGAVRDAQRAKAAVVSVLSKTHMERIAETWEKCRASNTAAAIQLAGICLEAMIPEGQFGGAMEHRRLLEALTHPADQPIVSVRLLRIATLLPPSKQLSAVVTLATEGCHKLFLPWGDWSEVTQFNDFSYSTMHTQALRELENHAEKMDEEGATKFLVLAEEVITKLQQKGRSNSAAKYGIRISKLIFGKENFEKSEKAGRFGLLTYGAILQAAGREDGRSCVQCLYAALFALTCTKSKQHDAVIGYLREAISEIQKLPSIAQVKVASGNTTLRLLSKVVDALNRIGDVPAAATISSHVSHFGRQFLAVCLIERCGRGMMSRGASRKKNSQRTRQPAAEETNETAPQDNIVVDDL